MDCSRCGSLNHSEDGFVQGRPRYECKECRYPYTVAKKSDIKSAETQRVDNNTKISIRFFDDREVRAVWDEENNKWWFNVVDIVAVLYGQDDYTKASNYWRWLKRKFVKDQNQLVSATHGFKFVAPDSKKRLADTLDSDA